MGYNQISFPNPSIMEELKRHGKVLSLFAGTRSILQEFNAMDERMTNQMLSIQQNAVSLGLIAQKLEDDYGSGGPTKQKNFFGLRKKKSGTGTASNGPPPVKSESNSRSSTLTSLQPEQQPRPQSPSLIDMDINDSTNLAAMAALSSSNPSLASTLSVTRPVSMPADAKSLNFSLVTREELVTIVQDLQHELATLVRTYTGDKEKLKALIVQQEEQAQFMNKTSTLSGNMQQLASLRQAYNQAMTQNASLRAKLQKIHMDSELCDMAQVINLIFVWIQSIFHSNFPSLLRCLLWEPLILLYEDSASNSPCLTGQYSHIWFILVTIRKIEIMQMLNQCWKTLAAERTSIYRYV